MIALALEIPTALLEKLEPFTDLDFVLAHRVLEDSYYADFYNGRPFGRELILDNSMHELGEPLPPKDLLEAADRVSANYLIAPDKLEDMHWTLGMFDELLEALEESPFHLRATLHLAANLIGNSPEDRAFYLKRVRSARMLCFPYRKPRFEWFEENLVTILLNWKRIHLLGMSEVKELLQWRDCEKHIGKHVRFSVDTAKPLKAAYVARSIEDGLPLRHIPISSKDLLGMTATPEQLTLMKENISFLRRILEP